MVKRRVDTSLEEWHEEGVRCAEANRTNVAAAIEEEVVESAPTVVEVPVGEEADRLTTAQSNVVELENSEWLWILLEQSGYERW